jgi:hypothetical protein
MVTSSLNSSPPKKEEIKCTMFGGRDSEALNALMSALFKAAGGKDNEHVYKFIEEMPKTSFICELYTALQEIGYQIKPL